MALVSLFNDPFMTDFERSVGNLLGAFPTSTSRPALPRAGGLSLPMDILETSSAYELHADTPGMAPEDLKVELHNGVLTLSGERKIVRDDRSPDGKVWRSERSSYSFSRAFTLPDNASAEGITATVDKGVLKVTVPKKQPEPKPEPKRNEVKTTASRL